MSAHVGGSIPAQAGEPWSSRSSIRALRVYPRAGGGTDFAAGRITQKEGLSPRRRGNLRQSYLVAEVHGSIPAQAGEPTPSRVHPRRSRVYPRAGGGTTVAKLATVREWGLSPRRRGNRGTERRRRAVPGSIPAQAGEPSCPCRRRRCSWVYPRAGGGTVPGRTRADIHAGLSPRRRGNHGAGRVRVLPAGSIPAQAGEPRLAIEPRVAVGVYPRAGGGTSFAMVAVKRVRGLSPRRRGNPRRSSTRGRSRGSIPAQAGEPRGGRSPSSGSRVYPRAGGGTLTRSAPPVVIEGLSPRRRGNLPLTRPTLSMTGSIPAQAGEP